MNRNELIIERDREEDINSINKINRIIYIITFLMLAIIPIMLQFHSIDFIAPNIIDYEYIRTGTKMEMYSFYKFILLVVGASMLLVLFIYKVIILDSRINIYSPINLTVLISIFIILFTSLFNNLGFHYLFGSYERYEGMLTYIAYLIIFFVLSNTLFTKKQVKKIIFALYPVTILNFIFSSLDFFGIEVLETQIFESLITLIENPSSDISINSTNVIFTTLYNQNYLSGLSAALSLMFILAAMYEEYTKYKIYHSIMAILSILMIFISLSSSGLFTFIIVGSLILITQARKFYTNKRVIINIFATCIFFVFALLISSHLDNRVETEFKDGFSKFTTFFQVNEIKQNNYHEDVLPNLPNPGIAGGTGRAYIWTETLELIRERPFIGYGFDTFPYVFDQNQLSKISNLRSSTVVVDKPHNWYLYITYNSGIFLLICILLIIILSYKKITRNNEDYLKNNNIILMVGTLSILIQWLVNDSVIGVAIIFWILLGFIKALNQNEEIDYYNTRNEWEKI